MVEVISNFTFCGPTAEPTTPNLSFPFNFWEREHSSIEMRPPALWTLTGPGQVSLSEDVREVVREGAIWSGHKESQVTSPSSDHPWLLRNGPQCPLADCARHNFLWQGEQSPSETVPASSQLCPLFSALETGYLSPMCPPITSVHYLFSTQTPQVSVFMAFLAVHESGMRWCFLHKLLFRSKSSSEQWWKDIVYFLLMLLLPGTRTLLSLSFSKHGGDRKCFPACCG